MAGLENLEFVKVVPKTVAQGGITPLERAREKFLGRIDTQITLAGNTELTVVKNINRRDGSFHTIERKPRSWVSYANDYAYIVVRISNKPINIGGSRGSVIRCNPNQVIETLQQIRKWAESDSANSVIEEAVKKSRRK